MMMTPTTLVQLCRRQVCSYEKERPPREKAVHVKDTEMATPEDKQRLLFKPCFKPHWPRHILQVGVSEAVIRL
jgi:hypothetical protein